MFPTTIWDVVHEAGAKDPRALEQFASEYRQPVLDYLRAKGAPSSDAEDLCQEVFLRLLAKDVLAKADANRGSFRALLRTITWRVLVDWHRRRRDPPRAQVEPAAPQPDFDRAWALHLTERALARLREESARYHEVLQRHLDGEKQDRQKLWIARKKLIALIRREIALTSRSPEEIEEEFASLAPYLQPGGKD